VQRGRAEGLWRRRNSAMPTRCFAAPLFRRPSGTRPASIAPTTNPQRQVMARVQDLRRSLDLVVADMAEGVRGWIAERGSWQQSPSALRLRLLKGLRAGSSSSSGSGSGSTSSSSSSPQPSLSLPPHPPHRTRPHRTGSAAPTGRRSWTGSL